MALRHYLVAAALGVIGTGCPATNYARTAPAAVVYREPPSNAITFWGHACAYIDIDGFGIVTDPVFATHYAIIRRRQIPAPPPSRYDQTRIVLISHAHHDHLDPNTLIHFPASAVILAPAPAAKYLFRRGILAKVMRPGDEYPFPGGSIIAVAAHHPGGRFSLHASADGRALGYVIRSARSTIYYSGDTDYFPGFAEIGARYRPDIAILNVNPHLHMPEALFAVADLGMPIVIPAHVGAYNGTSARRGPGWRRELVEALGSNAVPLNVGESLALPQAGRTAYTSARAYKTLSSSARHPFAVRVPEAPGISNLAEIETGLARGGQPKDEGIEYLRRRGFRTVVAFRRDPDERLKLIRAGLDYVEIPLRADLLGSKPPTEDQVRQFISITMDSTCRPLFFHCRRGMDRTGVMAAIYRIEACGWTSAEAVQEMRALGFHEHYKALLRFVRGYERRGLAPEK